MFIVHPFHDFMDKRQLIDKLVDAWTYGLIDRRMDEELEEKLDR